MAKIRLKSAPEVELMAQAGQIVADTLLMLKEHAKPGVSTAELNRLAETYMAQRNAVSSYREVNFNGVVCTAINEQVVHGIPGARQLRAGDLVSLDIAAIYRGYHADAAISFGVGAISPQAQHLIEVTENALALGMSLAQPGHRINEIGDAVQSYVEGHHMSVVRNLVGHGIGRSMWEEPNVPNYRVDERGPVLRPGMVFTIEPMVSAGGEEVVMLEDKWTIVTEDHSLAAHFEHTVAITERGVRILTQPSNRSALWAALPQRMSEVRASFNDRALIGLLPST